MPTAPGLSVLLGWMREAEGQCMSIGVKEPDPRWFWARVLMKSTRPERARRRHLWERLVFLLRAGDLDDARVRAEAIARSKEHEYVAATGDRVRWVFQTIEDVQELMDPIGDGTEVYWEFFERVDKTTAG